MSTTTIELETRHTRTAQPHQPDSPSVQNESRSEHPTLDQPAPDNAATVVPDGGYGWVVVFCCSVIAFWFSGLTGAWGVVQTALLSSTL